MSFDVIQYDISWDSQKLSDNLMQLDVIRPDDSKILIDQRIDGLTLLLMNETHFNELGFLVGPKIKLMHFIQQIKCKLSIEHKSLFDLHLAKSLFKPDVNIKSEFGGGDVEESRKTKLTRRPLSCSECGKTYSKPQYVVDHKRTAHWDSMINYSCKICGQTFGWRVNILKHIKKCHPNNKSIDMIDVLF